MIVGTILFWYVGITILFSSPFAIFSIDFWSLLAVFVVGLFFLMRFFRTGMLSSMLIAFVMWWHFLAGGAFWAFHEFGARIPGIAAGAALAALAVGGVHGAWLGMSRKRFY
jgi:hypothetical protein